MCHTERLLQRQNTKKQIQSVDRNENDQLAKEWRVGSLCQIFILENTEWIDGEIVHAFSDEIGEWIRVQYGQRIRDVLRNQPFVRERDAMNTAEYKTWFNVMQCVTQELFPVLSFKISECVQEKLVEDPTFKMTDIEDEAVDDILERLTRKRTMNNKEMEYLKDLVKRLRESKIKVNGEKS